jgi:uncharacterized cysteine cluster protein YcgN (CxxCxxCC family)
VSEKPFWLRKTLKEMTSAEWESLCDGCARCCLLKLENIETGDVFYTDVACKLLDLHACRCTRYKERQKLVHDCVRLTPENLFELSWMPSTCAYRLVHEGKDLYWWHPLKTGDPDSVHKAGMSVRGRVIPEKGAPDLEDRIVEWPE